MKPQKLRHLLSQHGKLGRIYLAPEDTAARTRRKKRGGDTGKHFSEGWIEFEDKIEAKRTAELLNNNPIGGRRRSAYHYDLWCIKYLPKFKWDHLTEEIAYQNAVREQRLAQEVSAATRERDFYLSQVNRAKGIAAQEERKRKRKREVAGSKEGQDPTVAPAPAPSASSDFRKAVRSYGQRKPKLDPVADSDAPMVSQDVLSLLAGKRR